MSQQAHSLARFIPMAIIITGFEPIYFSSTKISFKNGVFVFWAVLVSIKLLPMIKRRIIQNESFSQSINQGPVSVVDLQFFSPADVPTHPL